MTTVGREPASFAAAWATASSIPGWLTRAQAHALWDDAAAVPSGSLILEIGSHQGRSTSVLARAARSAGASVVAIDPFVEGRLFGGPGTRQLFERNLSAAGLRGLVRLVPQRSTDVRPGWDEPIALLYIDGKHDYWTVRDDLAWSRFLPDGGRMLVHDAFSSVGVTLGILRHVLTSDSVRYLGRVGSLARFDKAPPSAADRWRIARELPWWLRNLAIKVVLRAGRLVGHRSTPDPY